MPFNQVGAWVTPSDYKIAQPDPLRDCTERLVNEINANHVEDVNRFCNIYIDINFQVCAISILIFSTIFLSTVFDGFFDFCIVITKF